MRSLLVLQSLAIVAASQSTTAPTDVPADANRTPDTLPLDFLRGVPAPTYSTIEGALSQDIPYASATAIAVASAEQAATPLSVFPAVTTVPINAAGEDISAATPTNAPERRDVEQNLEKRTACEVYPTVSNFYSIQTSGGVASFKADPTISSIASQATAPAGYFENFKNLPAANSAYGYLGYTVVEEYDTAACAVKCTEKEGCLAFNIFFERDPSVEPGTGCENPDPLVVIKCSFWGSALDKTTATNDGQWRAGFQVAIAGSNAYTSDAIAKPISGWDEPLKLNNAILNAPLRDCANTWTYMGYKLFNEGPYDVALCAAACDAQNEYNIAHPPTNGDNLALCAAFGTYQLTQNTQSGSKVLGQMCTMYTSAWDAQYAVNKVSYDDGIGANYTYSLSYFYSKNDRQPICSADLDYLASNGADFCTSFISYTPGVTTTVQSTTTPAVSTIYSTTTVRSTTTVFTTTVTQTVTAAIAKRDLDARTVAGAAIATPASITNWPASRISAACSKVATGSATATSIITAVAPLTTSFTTVTSYSTVLAATTSTSTAPAAPNMYTNGGFETGTLSSWTYDSGSGNTGGISSQTHHNGAYAFEFKKKSGTAEQYGGISQAFSTGLKKGKRYTYSFWAKHADANPSARCSVYWQGILGQGWWTGGVVITTVYASDWTRYSGTFTMPTNWDASGMYVSVSYCTGGDTANPGSFFMDDLYVAEVA
ncbi:hypothetical protein B0J12DRAFT_124638 [Macrophomina phaseolina]|uniref:CBM-cenC domain-containing protein n=1 Tax=Macrophomina phaseolina TaxID=35725 RepID=A0ABQ8GAV5_9PEZI|nr:hypothetical protein B0J12DRAFT_124638 [Macrophomina phaseolina]